MLVAAIVGGHFAHWAHVPRVVGFLVGGAALRAILMGIWSSEEAGATLAAAAVPLKAIQDLALGLILFKIGAVFDRSQIRAAGSRVRIISIREIGSTVVVVFLGCLIGGMMTMRDHAPGDVAILAMLLALAAIATAPAATLFVLQEYEAKGAVTDTILGLTGVNNIVCIVVFYAAFLLSAWAGWISTGGDLSRHIVLALGMTTVGSVALGAVLGVLICVTHAKLPLAETMLVFFAVFILLGAGEKWLLEHFGVSFNFLLTALTIGAVFANVGMDSEKLNTGLRTVGSPIFSGFFVLAGYSLHLNDLAHMGWIGAAYIIARYFGKTWGCRLGMKSIPQPLNAQCDLGSALLCQAAVVIGLASFVQQNWDHELAKTFSTVILGSVVVFELTGPLLVKRCVRVSGEVKLLTLMSRGSDASEEASMLRLTVRSALRLLGVRSKKATSESAPMTVEHLMRTNVQTIPASATLEEVLRFMERSTYTHFPVLDEDGDLSGVIHFSDVRDVIYDPALSGLVTAVDLADTNAPVVYPDMPIAELLTHFDRDNVAVLPVCENQDSRRVIGLVEQRDLLNAMHRNSAGAAAG